MPWRNCIGVFSNSWKPDPAGHHNWEGKISQWKGDGSLNSSGYSGISKQSTASGQSSTDSTAGDVEDQNPGVRGCQTQVSLSEHPV